MNSTVSTLYKPVELDDSAAWSAYQRAEMAAITQTIRLRDGEAVTMRAIRPDDAQRLQAFHARLSADTIVMRYFRVAPVLYEKDARWLTHLDYDNRMALVATTGEGADERIIAVVRYERVTASEAELAFVVEDRWQGRGISTALLVWLLAYAKARGFETMVAVTLATNVRMRAVMVHAGYPINSHYADGCLTLTLDIRQAG
ncbi:MAG TPA: GNAT family protein [Ktedonobacterales bacterium]|jgi:RimJ/RimL family protein N-acetyltransferase|nr:GNAT family protein [Ktedonobacterales bacterium]